MKFLKAITGKNTDRASGENEREHDGKLSAVEKWIQELWFFPAMASSAPMIIAAADTYIEG